MGLWAVVIAMGTAQAATTLLAEKADLNGDGKNDKVQVVADGAPLQAVKITIGGVSLADKQMYATVAARVVDIDPTDKARQLLVEGTSESGKKWFTLFGYNGKAVVQLLKASTKGSKGDFILPNDGTLVLKEPDGFFERRQAWAMAGNAIVSVSQPFQYVGATAAVKAPLALVTEPGSQIAVTKVTSGELKLLIANQQEPTWFLASGPNGLVGWVPGTAIGRELEVTPLSQ